MRSRREKTSTGRPAAWFRAQEHQGDRQSDDKKEKKD